MQTVDAREYAELEMIDRVWGVLGPERQDRQAAVVGMLAGQSAELKFDGLMDAVSGRETKPLTVEQQMAIVAGCAPPAE